LARCAAMPPPMTPEPRTATVRIGLVMIASVVRVRVG
jgi:hypothetical protein